MGHALSSFGPYVTVVGICRFFVGVTITLGGGNNQVLLGPTRDSSLKGTKSSSFSYL